MNDLICANCKADLWNPKPETILQFCTQFCCSMYKRNEVEPVVKEEGITYCHFVHIFVPVYQKGRVFTYSMGDATHDEQVAWSLGPDAVLELSGIFDATTDPTKHGDKT